MDTFRRNACPSLAAPMRTGDGWLARLPPLVAPMTPAMLAALASAASRHGNGLVEISKRGNLQLRGLAEDGAGGLAADVAEAGFDLTDGIPISLDALAALAGIDAAPIVQDLHRRIDEADVAVSLAPKFTIVLDFGSPLAPVGLSADLRLAFRDGRVAIGLGGDDAGDANWIGWIAAAAAIDAALSILEALAAHGPGARLRGPDGLADDPAIAAAAASLTDAGVIPCATAADAAIGPITGYEVAVQGIAFPFGQSDAEALLELAEAASREGLVAFAPAPDGCCSSQATTIAVCTRRGIAARLHHRAVRPPPLHRRLHRQRGLRLRTHPRHGGWQMPLPERSIPSSTGRSRCISRLRPRGARILSRPRSRSSESTTGRDSCLTDGHATRPLESRRPRCCSPALAALRRWLPRDLRARRARAALDSMERAGILGAMTGEAAGDDDDRGESRNDPRDERLSA